MPEQQPPRWLDWAREVQALAQTGYYYAENDYQRQRYRRLTEIAAEIVQSHTDMGYEPLIGVFQAQAGYATPRVDVRGAVFREGKLLLVRERMDEAWTMPGGWADVGDVPSQAAEREVWEEAGFRVQARKLIGANAAFGFVTADLRSGQGQALAQQIGKHFTRQGVN
ncbi:MAG TPA: NUDIX hydrolase N-terminal domain-containing protein, partial [Anaerolineales bacterium]